MASLICFVVVFKTFFNKLCKFAGSIRGSAGKKACKNNLHFFIRTLKCFTTKSLQQKNLYNNLYNKKFPRFILCFCEFLNSILNISNIFSLLHYDIIYLNASGISHSRNSFSQKTGISWHVAQHLNFHTEVGNKKEKKEKEQKNSQAIICYLCRE